MATKTNCRKKIGAILILAVISLFFMSACMRTAVEKPFTKTNFMLDTLIKIQIYGANASDAADKVFKRIDDIEKKMTSKEDYSEVAELNKRAGKEFFKISPDTFFVIKKGIEYSQRSMGRFDITIGPLIDLWGIGTNKARVPSDEEIKKVLPLIDYRLIKLDETQNSILLEKEGMSIDLGGIAKGFAADEAVKILRQESIKSAIVDLGGNIFAVGTKPDGNPWKIGLQNPFETRGSICATVEVIDKTLVTSGPYERYFEENGKIYHHILDKNTGYPVENNLMGVTIIADSSIDADALSTAAYSMGLDEGMKFIESIKDVEAVFITDDYTIFASSGIKKYNLQITNSNFKIEDIK